MHGLLPVTRQVIKMSGGARQIAPMIGFTKPNGPNVLLNQVCQTNRQHKLGAEDLQRIIRLCRPHSIQIVQVLAAEIGCVVIELPREGIPYRDFPHLVLQAGKTYGEVSEALIDSVDPDGDGGVDVTLKEFHNIEEKIYLAHRVFQEILSLARKLSGLSPNRPKQD